VNFVFPLVLATISTNPPKPVIPAGAARPFLPRSLLRTSRAASWRNLFSIDRASHLSLVYPRDRCSNPHPLPTQKNNSHTSQLFHSPFPLKKTNSPHFSPKNSYNSRHLFTNPFLNSKITLVEILCKLCERSQSPALTFPLPPAPEWATIPRCHFPVLRGPAIPKRTRTVCRGELLALPRARIRRLKKDELGLLSTAFSHLWK
jgi:hypothetical protein